MDTIVIGPPQFFQVIDNTPSTLHRVTILRVITRQSRRRKVSSVDRIIEKRNSPPTNWILYLLKTVDRFFFNNKKTCTFNQIFTRINAINKIILLHELKLYNFKKESPTFRLRMINYYPKNSKISAIHNILKSYIRFNTCICIYLIVRGGGT